MKGSQMDFTLDDLNNSNNNLKSGFVTMIGRPNVGKSTLLNYIMGQKLAITSNKPQTTRKRIRAVLTEEDKGQIVFLDTPGIHKSKSKLGNYMSGIVKNAVSDVDVIIWLVEPRLPIHREDKEIAKVLENADKPIILGINKIDMIKKDVLKEVLDSYQNLAPFAEIYPFSARNGKGIEQLMGAIYSRLPYGPFYYDPEEYTDQTERELVCEIIREKSLHALRDEIPHGIAVTVESMKERKDKPIVDIEATIICEEDSHKGIIIGKGGAMLKKIGTNARFEIERMLDMKANIQIHVKVKKDWRDNIGVLRSLGYTEDED
jgi:GTP-binding protein Era